MDPIHIAAAVALGTGATLLMDAWNLLLMIYGIATVVFPYFVMQPSFGLGIAGSSAPDPARVRLKSLVTHVVFGLGLYGSAAGVGYVLRAYA